jgi:predicted PurR-regulated permease PerM
MIYLSIILLIISGLSKTIEDISASNYSTSKLSYLNASFWNKSISWKNKWKNGDESQGEKFLGSSTIFVFITDAWHLFDLIRDITLIISLLLTPIIYFFIMAYPIRQLLFSLFYKILIKK